MASRVWTSEPPSALMVQPGGSVDRSPALVVQQSGTVDQSVAVMAQRQNDREPTECVEGAGPVDDLHMTVHDIECIQTFLGHLKTDGNNRVAIEQSRLTVRTTLAGGSDAEQGADLKYLKSKTAELRKTFECHGMGEVINIQAGSLQIILRLKRQDDIKILQTRTYLDVGKKKLQDVLTKGREERDACKDDIDGLTLQADEQDLEQATHFFLADPITVPVKFLYCRNRNCWYWTLDEEILHGLNVFSVQAGTHIGRRLFVHEVELVQKLQRASTAPSDVEPRSCLICESRADFIYDQERPFGDKEAALTSKSPIQETDVPRPVGLSEHREDGDQNAGAAAAEPGISVAETEPPGDFQPAGQSLSAEEAMEWTGPRDIADGRMGHDMRTDARFDAEDMPTYALDFIDHYQPQSLFSTFGIVEIGRPSEGSLLLPIVLLSREELKTIKCERVQQMLLKRMQKLLIDQRKAGGVPAGALESLTIKISPEDIDKLEHFYAADPIPLPARYVFCGETRCWYWTADGDIFHRVDVCRVQAGKYLGKRLREHEIQLCWKLWQLTEGPLADHNRCSVCKHRQSNDGHIFPKEAAEKPEAHDSSTSTTAKPGEMIEETEHEMAAAGGEEMESKVEESTGKATEERPSTLESSEKQPEDKEDYKSHPPPWPPQWLKRRDLQYSSSDRAKLRYYSVRGQSAMNEQALLTGWFENFGKLDPFFTGLQITFIHDDDVASLWRPPDGMVGLAYLTSKDLRVVSDQGQWSVWVGGKEPHASPKDRRLLSGRSSIVKGLEEYEVDPEAFYWHWDRALHAVKTTDNVEVDIDLPIAFLHMPPRGSVSRVMLLPAIAVPSDEVAGVEPSPNPLYLTADFMEKTWTPIMVTENPGLESSHLPHKLASISLGASGEKGEEVEGEAGAGVR